MEICQDIDDIDDDEIFIGQICSAIYFDDEKYYLETLKKRHPHCLEDFLIVIDVLRFFQKTDEEFDENKFLKYYTLFFEIR